MSSQGNKRVLKGIGFLLVLTLFLIPLTSALTLQDVIHWIMEKFGVTYDEAVRMVESTTKSYSFNLPQSQPQEQLTITKTGYEKYLFYNVQAEKNGNTITLNADINATVFNFLKDAYTNPTAGKCLIVQNYLSSDGITPPSCAELYTILQDRYVNGFKMIKNGIETGRISVSGNHLTATFDANNIKDLDVFKLGDNSITIQYQMVQGNILFNDGNLTYQPSNITHLNISSTAPYNSLVAYYMFDSYRAGTKIFDMSDNNNDASITSDITTAKGVYDDFAVFEGQGSNDHMNATYSNSLNTSTSLTISIWVNTSSGTVNTFARKGQTSWSWNLGKSSTDYLSFSVTSVAPSTIAIQYPMPTNAWVHGAGTFNGTDISLYLNGVLVNTSTTGAIVLRSDKEPLQIGSVNNGTGLVNTINGGIDEIMLFNTALTAQQISDIYTNSSARFKPQGSYTYLQQLLSLSAGDDSLSCNADYEKNFGSNAQCRFLLWNKTLDYNNSDGTMPLYYHFDGDLTNSGSPPNAVALVGTSFNKNGVFNDSIFCDGVDDVINTTKDFDFVSNELSYSGWFKTGDSDSQVILSTGAGVDELQIALHPVANRIRVRIDGITTTLLDYPFVSDERWHHLGVTYKSGDNYRLYFDGVIVNSTIATGTMDDAVGEIWYLCSRLSSGAFQTFYNGSLDEQILFNRSISATEMQSIYIKGRANWQYTDYINLNSSINITALTRNVAPEIKLLAGNSTNPFYTPLIIGGLVNVTVTSSAVPPSIVFNWQQPSDINTSSVVSIGVNISYNISDNLALNTSRVTFYHKTNSSLSDTTYFINGTAYSGWLQGADFTSNESNVWRFALDDNKVLSGTYNYDPHIMELEEHNYTILTGNNNYISIELQNISTVKNVSTFEIMANASLTTNPLRIYYCNSSYTTGVVHTSPNCAETASITANNTFNHCHPNSKSCHNLVTIVKTSGQISGITVTPTSKFLLRGTTGDWFIHYIFNKTRDNAIQTTANSGASWTGQTYTIDAHSHAYSYTGDVFRYYVCANDTLNNEACSTPREDSIGLGNLPPSAPLVYSPERTNYYGPTININYTASISPNGYTISYYNITLINATSGALVKTIYPNNLNLSYVWDISSELDGTYRVDVKAVDSQGQSAIGISHEFNISLDITAPAIQIISPENGSSVSTITPTLNITTNDAGVLACKYSTTSGAINVTFGLPTTIMTVGTGENVVKVWCNDTAGNIGYNESTFTVSLGAGSLCGVSAFSTRNGSVVTIHANSWDTAGAYASYTLTGSCRDRLGGTITFPTFTTYATGKYWANFSLDDAGTCEISAPSCTKATVGWSALSSSTVTPTSSACTVNSTSLLSKSSTRPYGQLCNIKEFK